MLLGCTSKFILRTLSSSFIGVWSPGPLGVFTNANFPEYSLDKICKKHFRVWCPQVGRREDAEPLPEHPRFKSLMLRRGGVSPRRSTFLTPSLSEFRLRLCPWRALQSAARDIICAFS